MSGPITFILDLNKSLKFLKLQQIKKTLGVRFPTSSDKKFIKEIRFSSAASANISTKVSAVCSSDVEDDFEKIKYILEGGRSSIGVESTIIDLEINQNLKTWWFKHFKNTTGVKKS